MVRSEEKGRRSIRKDRAPVGEPIVNKLIQLINAVQSAYPKELHFVHTSEARALREETVKAWGVLSQESRDLVREALAQGRGETQVAAYLCLARSLPCGLLEGGKLVMFIEKKKADPSDSLFARAVRRVAF